MTTARADKLEVQIVEALEEYGLDRYDFMLYDFVDLDALKLLIAHAPPETQVSFPVEDIEVTVHGDGEIDVQSR